MDGEDQSGHGSLRDFPEGKWVSHLPEHPRQQVRNAGAQGHERGASIKLFVVSGILMTPGALPFPVGGLPAAKKSLS